MIKEKPSTNKQPAKEKKISPLSLTSTDIAEAKFIERELLAKKLTGSIPLKKFWLQPCRIKILMVMDNADFSDASFNRWYFGLSEALETIQQNPEWWVKFDVDRAHRQSDPNPPSTPAGEALYAPTYENFRFDQPGFNINKYNEIWFFGVHGDDSSPPADTSGMGPDSQLASHLAETELEILYAWMDQGGGVFATGDHANLGSALCGDIPRVRNMRKWKESDSPPPGGGFSRHDTLEKGHDYAATIGIDESDEYTFDDESDDVPMTIRPRWYWHLGYQRGWNRFYRLPHPILCGKDGVINILPDHPHEGEVVVGSDLTLTAQPRTGGYSSREFPDLNGNPLSPEIIAWARVQDDHTPSDFKGEVEAKEFGCIGAYNGHRVDVGRVVTDSTWHHWFDVNLNGRMFFNSATTGQIETGDPRKENGFYDTPAGEAELDRIKNYFRNVAIWLAPEKLQRCMALRMIWGGLFRYPLIEELDPKLSLTILGHLTLDTLELLVGKCASRFWIQYWFPQELTLEMEIKKPLKRLDMVDTTFSNLEVDLVGGVIKTMLEYRAEKYDRNPSDTVLESLVINGIKKGAKNFLEEYSQGKKKLSSIESLTKSLV